jgi:hypothetical protein
LRTERKRDTQAERAKRAVEIAIERNEAAALQFVEKNEDP